MFAHVVASRKMQIACNQRVFRLIIMRIFFLPWHGTCQVPFAYMQQQRQQQRLRQRQKQLDPPGGFQIQYYGYYRPLSGPPGAAIFN